MCIVSGLPLGYFPAFPFAAFASLLLSYLLPLLSIIIASSSFYPLFAFLVLVPTSAFFSSGSVCLCRLDTAGSATLVFGLQQSLVSLLLLLTNVYPPPLHRLSPFQPYHRVPARPPRVVREPTSRGNCCLPQPPLRDNCCLPPLLSPSHRSGDALTCRCGSVAPLFAAPPVRRVAVVPPDFHRRPPPSLLRPGLSSLAPIFATSGFPVAVSSFPGCLAAVPATPELSVSVSFVGVMAGTPWPQRVSCGAKRAYTPFKTVQVAPDIHSDTPYRSTADNIRIQPPPF